MQITISMDEAKFIILKQLGLDAKLYSRDGVSPILASQHSVEILDTVPAEGQNVNT